MDEIPFGTGAIESPKDIRTFTYSPDLSHIKGGTRYSPEDIENQYKVGICTAISLTQNARKAKGIKYSADFQYLLQKTEYDRDWNEGSSIFHALKVAKNFGLLPEEYWTWTTESDRKTPYYLYIKKLQAIPKEEIDRLKLIAAKNKILAYASVPVTRDALANAIDESDAGVLARFTLGKEWWTDPVEPLRPPREVVSGHAVTESNFDGGSVRIANSWGQKWADKGTAYHLLSQYKPTEAWMVYYQHLPEHVDVQLKKREELMGKLVDLLQQLLTLLKK